MSFSTPAPIGPDALVDQFDCGKEALNAYLKRFALVNTAAGISRTYITTPTGDKSVAGYYSLSAGSIEKAHVPERIAKGIPNYPVPVILLGRLAVHRAHQGHGLGKGLLRDALQRTLAAADVIAIRAVLVHAKDPEARRFYEQFGFAPSPTNDLHLMLLMKDLKRTVGLQ
jgi:GNAT superfamily N-acetyltransferase